jgi:hypothetical protein
MAHRKKIKQIHKYKKKIKKKIKTFVLWNAFGECPLLCFTSRYKIPPALME